MNDLVRAAIPSLALCLAVGCSSHEERDWVTIPRPVHISVDDCGWQSGASLGSSNGPYRLGARDPTLEDYARLARIAKASGTRLLTLWVLSELDRSGICARPEYNQPLAPSDMTERGLAWDNSLLVSDANLSLMSFMRSNAAWLEFGLHGVRHEHWAEGVRTRAEFGNKTGESWGIDNTTTHLACFTELMRQYYTPEESSFPASFVPPDHAYPTNESDSKAESAVLNSFGVRFLQMPGSTRFESGVFLMDRDTTSSPTWSAEAALPGQPSEHQSWMMTHLPNFYGRDDEWIQWLSDIDIPMNTFLPKNSALAASQILYSAFTRMRVSSDGLYLNTRDIPSEAYEYDLLSPIVLKVKLSGHTSIALSEASDLKLVAMYYDRHDHAILMLSQSEQPQGRLAQTVFHVQFDWDASPRGDWIDLGSSTLLVHSLERNSARTAQVDVEVYGQQTFDWIIPGFSVTSLRSDNPAITVLDWTWHPDLFRLSVTVTGRNMQGERGHLFAYQEVAGERRDASSP